MKVISLFSGIGGIELGFQKQGFETQLFCEIMLNAQAVIKKRFNAEVHSDIRSMKSFPKADIVTAGFPCQDLSIAGKKRGIAASNSSLISHVFRLLSNLRLIDKPKFIVLENVPYLLSLNKGEAVKFIIKEVENLGYNWAYRVVDVRSFGIPQRRPRLIFLASNIGHPKNILFSNNEPHTVPFDDKLGFDGFSSYGFYWTEGRIGIGWAKNSIPPIKGGSGLGIPSPPAVWIPAQNFFGTPQIEDAERLQGFPEDWTRVFEEGSNNNYRWKLIGNAVNPKVSEWLAKRILIHETYSTKNDSVLSNSKWPNAAYSYNNKVFAANVSVFPESHHMVPVHQFINKSFKALSYRASMGFYNRAISSSLIKYPPEFLNSLQVFISQYGNN